MGALKSPKNWPWLGIQRPKWQSQSNGESVCIVLPSPAVLPVKEASLIEDGVLERYSTEPELSALLSMKSTPAMKATPGLFCTQMTPPSCGCEERAG